MVGTTPTANSALRSGLDALGVDPQLAALTFDQPQWTEATTTITTTSNLPPEQMLAREADYGTFVPQTIIRQTPSNDPNDWTAWPVTLQLVERYRRTDKVEFWASVAAIGYYLGHCVLGVL